jgi:hypothetical protein
VNRRGNLEPPEATVRLSPHQVDATIPRAGGQTRRYDIMQAAARLHNARSVDRQVIGLENSNALPLPG